MAKMKSEKSGGGNLHKGMSRNSPSASDKSTQMKMSPSVDSDATRSGVAKQPRTLGPREA